MEATIKEVREFFDIPVSQFAKEWRMLSDKDKADLKKRNWRRYADLLTY